MTCTGSIRVTRETCAATHDIVRSQLRWDSFTKQWVSQHRLKTGLRDSPDILRLIHMMMRTVDMRVLVLMRTISTVRQPGWLSHTSRGRHPKAHTTQC